MGCLILEVLIFSLKVKIIEPDALILDKDRNTMAKALFHVEYLHVKQIDCSKIIRPNSYEASYGVKAKRTSDYICELTEY